MLVRGQRNFLQTADFSVQAGRYAVAWADKLSTDSRFLSPSLAYTVMWAEKIQNIRYIIDNISVQAGRYAVAWAESSAHMRSKICKKAYLFDKEKHLW